MFGGGDFFAVVVVRFSGFDYSNELLTRVWVLTGAEPLILFALDFSCEVPFFG